MDETIGAVNVEVGAKMIRRREPAVRRRRVARPRVHERGEARLDAMLALAEEASRSAPLADVLASLASRIAALLAVDVCSIYLRELDVGGMRDGGELVLRATHGWPQAAVGAVRMRVGEGLTGFAVECLRPVSVARAPSDARNKPFAGLDEQRFPSLCALPLVDGGRAVGALVIQRRQPRAFGSREIVLAASVCAPVLFALERGRSRDRDAAGAAGAAAPALHRPREVLLRGVGAGSGAALGTACVRRHAHRPATPRRRGDPADERALLGRAIADAAEEVTQLEAWATQHAPIDVATMAALLSSSRFVLDDARLRGRMLKHVRAGAAAEDAVERVMHEYTRVLTASGDALLGARALEVEALCLRVLARLGSARPALDPGTVLCTSRLTVCDALELAAAHGSAVVLAGAPDASPGVPIACALGLPVVAAVKELYRWVADGDRLLVDADAGSAILNPSRVDVTAHRRRQ
jgi:phosphotransferase system, enzyme I, PtsP